MLVFQLPYFLKNHKLRGKSCEFLIFTWKTWIWRVKELNVLNAVWNRYCCWIFCDLLSRSVIILQPWGSAISRDARPFYQAYMKSENPTGLGIRRVFC